MKKLVLPILLLLSVGSANAMWGWFKSKPVQPAITTTEDVKLPFLAAGSAKLEEAKLIGALKAGNAESVKAVITAENVNKEFTLPLYAGQTPLSFLFTEGFYKSGDRFAVAEALIEAGANKDALKPILESAKSANDSELVQWLLDHGVGDTSVATQVAADAQQKLEATNIFNTAFERAKEKMRAQEAAAQPVIATEEVKTPLVEEAITPVVAIEEPVAAQAPIASEDATMLPEAAKAEELVSEPVIAEELITVVNPISNYPVRLKQLLPAPTQEISVVAPDLTVNLEGETAEQIKAPAKVWPSVPAPMRVQELPVTVTPKVARPLPPTPAKPMIFDELESEELLAPVVKRPLPPTPARRMQEVQVTVTPKVARPLPPTPKVAFDELETAEFTPAVKTGRPLPVLPTQRSILPK
ncbi:hypothetical protein BH09DEP1_BH09DEP1_4130 [soil metagenome]